MQTISNQTITWAREKQLRHWFKDETTSTNDVAKQEVETIEDFKLYVTNWQTKGRGRGENTWTNPSERNSLLSTWVYKCNTTPQHFLPALMGLSLLQACKSTWSSLAWSLKAPNDCFINDKKVAGLLIETISQGDETFILVGLGFNVFSSPEEIQTSSHLLDFLGDKKSFSNEQWLSFLNELKANFDSAIEQSEQIKISEENRDQLLEALNANPFKKEIYIEITDQGDLVTEKETISWRDL